MDWNPQVPAAHVRFLHSVSWPLQSDGIEHCPAAHFPSFNPAMQASADAQLVTSMASRPSEHTTMVAPSHFVSAALHTGEAHALLGIPFTQSA
jgi:hypothetical protein